MSIVVLHPSLCGTIQDGGRKGYQHQGVGPSGPMDWFALRAANTVVGNPPEAPALELTGAHGSFRFDADALICCVGRDLLLEGGQPIPAGRMAYIRAGDTIHLCPNGGAFRCTLAVAGGMSTPRALGSASTHSLVPLLDDSLRPLRKGLWLPVGHPTAWARDWMNCLAHHSSRMPRWHPGPAAQITPPEQPVLGVVADSRVDPQLLLTTPLFRHAYRLSPQSNRMAALLEGPALAPIERSNVLSTGVCFGTIQLPPGGQPIILCADRQTTGGYPVLGQIITADLPLLARSHPGQLLHLRLSTRVEAHSARQKMEHTLHRMSHGIASQAVTV